MSTWILQHFLNPALFWPGLALVSLPIIIHLINRLRYRTVRFAAMEFLFASEQKNRRRVLIEQMLLLLARILLVLLILALVGRLILDPRHLSLFQGAKTHHVVLLDDSGSMRDQVGEGSAFDQAKIVLRDIIAQGADRPGTQRITVVMLSNPTVTTSGFTEREVDTQLLDDAAAQLQDLTCTYQSGSLEKAIETIKKRLTDDRATEKVLHILSDFRRVDWNDDAGLTTELKACDAAGVSLNLVRLVPEPHENLAVTELTGSVETAAVGVPVSLRATIANYGTREIAGTKLSVAIDGQMLNRRETIPTVPAGETREVAFDVDFPSSGLHRVEVSLGPDGLEADNIRRLAIDVPQSNPVLIIDGTSGAIQGQYVADSLAADQAVTGYAVTIDGPDGLRKRTLDQYSLVYMLNVADLPPDAVEAVQKYVSRGGGLAWFAGETINAAFYNQQLYAEGKGLLPMALGMSPALLPPSPSSQAADLEVTDHPIFSLLAGQENPLVDFVTINAYFPVDRDRSLAERSNVIARLRDGSPLMIEHEFGQGRVIACLTSAGPTALSETLQKLALAELPTDAPPPLVWNDWASGNASPTFVVAQLELAKRLARRDRSLPRMTVGEEIQTTLDLAQFREDVEITTPDERVIKIKATRNSSTPETSTTTEAPAQAVLAFRETEMPGVYGLRRYLQDQSSRDTLLAFNVPVSESQMTLASDDQLKKQLTDITYTIQAPGALDWIRRESPGEDVRWWILWGLILIGLAEQTLASRVSYHKQ
ncbi:MAG: VWA domain-containing protein [Planctomycetota bacterium]|nr:MAG: VWA domain-containing protein [Planctomycetota bacterium]